MTGHLTAALRLHAARFAAVAAVAVFALFAGAGTTSAHASLIDTNPAKGAVLESAPEQATLTFNEPVRLPSDALRVGVTDRICSGILMATLVVGEPSQPFAKSPHTTTFGSARFDRPQAPPGAMLPAVDRSGSPLCSQLVLTFVCRGEREAGATPARPSPL